MDSKEHIILRYTTLKKGTKIPVLFHANTAWVKLKDVALLFDVSEKVIDQFVEDNKDTNLRADFFNDEAQGKPFEWSLHAGDIRAIGEKLDLKEGEEFWSWVIRMSADNPNVDPEEFERKLREFFKNTSDQK